MFRFFVSSTVKLEEKDFRAIFKNAKDVEYCSKYLQNVMKNILSGKVQRNTKTDEEIKKVLRRMLTALHSEDAAVKKAIRDELQREQGR